jgi:hypothetical protein
LATVIAACPELAATARHVRDFADLMNKKRGDRIDSWIQQVEADDLPHLHSLAVGLRRDLAAVTAGLTETYSSGPVEGNVNRVKRSKDRCTAAPASNSYESESSSPPDRLHKISDRTELRERRHRIPRNKILSRHNLNHTTSTTNPAASYKILKCSTGDSHIRGKAGEVETGYDRDDRRVVDWRTGNRDDGVAHRVAPRTCPARLIAVGGEMVQVVVSRTAV